MTSGASDLRFVPATETDLARMNELINDPEVIRYLNILPPVSMDRTHAFFNFVQAKGFPVWCLKLPDVGTVGVASLIPEDPSTKLGRNATFALYLMPACWGKGLGKATMQFLEAEALKRGLHRLECTVAADNSRAFRLYEGLGFVREGVKRKAFFNGSQYEDLVLMGKLLD